MLLRFQLFIQDSGEEQRVKRTKKKETSSSNSSITHSSLTPSMKEEGKEKEANNSSSVSHSSVIPPKISSDIQHHVSEWNRLLCSGRLIVEPPRDKTNKVACSPS